MKKISYVFVLIFSALLLFNCGGKSSEKSGNAVEANISNTGEKQDGGRKRRGCDLDQEEFKKTEIFAVLDRSSDKNELPAAVSLVKYAPKPSSQGSQGSCTSWACNYAARTILESVATGKDPNANPFSPAYLYNQITKGNCTGTNIGVALDKMKVVGGIGLKEFPYTDQDCSKQPDAQMKQVAQANKIVGYNRLTFDDSKGEKKAGKVDIIAMKQNLAKGAPIVIGILVGGTFGKVDKEGFWKPTQKDIQTMKTQQDGHKVDDDEDDSFGGHAMCIVAYDDKKGGGAFQIMNSWGSDWADKGFFWMTYKDFELFSNEYYSEVYGLDPLPSKKSSNIDFSASVGLLDNKTKSYLGLQKKAGYVFATKGVQKAGTKFKIEFTNSTACYTYVFGQETDGTSYVLFPYTEKHSPYCGITGTRVFPKDFSMQLDNVGTKDVFVVVLSKEKLDFNALNEKISSGSGDYESKVKAALGNKLIPVGNIKAKGGDAPSFDISTSSQTAFPIVIEVAKK
ncbi:MAG: DUF4384 domain-containing protein [Bacteroidetes bacterium]|nr:MAG: DUF4384 domain-containing protein [Bacteroidota bacterium]